MMAQSSAVHWHVAQCRPRGELIAKMNVDKLKLDAFLPTLSRRRQIGRRAADLIEPLFPGYLFVAFDPHLTQWRKIAAQRGVVRLLCHGDRPDTIPDGVIDRLRERANADGLIPDDSPETIIRYAVGKWLRLVDGPFAGHPGMVAEQYDGKGRVSLLLSILGSQRNIAVPLEHLAASA